METIHCRKDFVHISNWLLNCTVLMKANQAFTHFLIISSCYLTDAISYTCFCSGLVWESLLKAGLFLAQQHLCCYVLSDYWADRHTMKSNSWSAKLRTLCHFLNWGLFVYKYAHVHELWVMEGYFSLDVLVKEKGHILHPVKTLC